MVNVAFRSSWFEGLPETNDKLASNSRFTHSYNGEKMSETSLGSSPAVEKQIDQMETMATAFVIPSLVVILAAAAIPKEFEIFGFQLKMADAYCIVLAIFDVMVLLFCTACWKACDLLEACDETESSPALVVILTHKWFLNPFSYTGGGILSALWCSVGASLLILAWWVALCALALLSSIPSSHSPIERSLYALYWALGILGAVTVLRLARRIYLLSKSSQRRTPVVAFHALATKAVLSTVALVVGIWLFYAFTHLA